MLGFPACSIFYLLMFYKRFLEAAIRRIIIALTAGRAQSPTCLLWKLRNVDLIAKTPAIPARSLRIISLYNFQAEKVNFWVQLMGRNAFWWQCPCNFDFSAVAVVNDSDLIFRKRLVPKTHRSIHMNSTSWQQAQISRYDLRIFHPENSKIAEGFQANQRSISSIQLIEKFGHWLLHVFLA